MIILRYILIKTLVKSPSTHKHLRMVLGTKLDFSLHLKKVQSKLNKTRYFLRKLQNTLPKTLLITVFKPFIKLHLDMKTKFMIEHITLFFIKISNQFNSVLH